MSESLRSRKIGYFAILSMLYSRLTTATKFCKRFDLHVHVSLSLSNNVVHVDIFCCFFFKIFSNLSFFNVFTQILFSLLRFNPPRLWLLSISTLSGRNTRAQLNIRTCWYFLKISTKSSVAQETSPSQSCASKYMCTCTAHI